MLKRNVVVNDLCQLCGSTPESVSHLFLHCEKVWPLWSAIMLREGTHWVIPGSLAMMMDEWESLAAVTDKLLWKIIPASLVWSLWLGRNDALFKDKRFSTQETWDLHLLRASWWVKGSWPDCPYEIPQLLSNYCHIKIKRKLCAPRLAQWDPPQLGILKFNVDGSSMGNPGWWARAQCQSRNLGDVLQKYWGWMGIHS